MMVWPTSNPAVTKSNPYDIIVSNPPYVREIEKEQMHRNVLDFEPSEALFVPNNDPLIFYRAIAHFAKAQLHKNGALYLEINENLAIETMSLFQEYGFSECMLRQDLNGKNRMLKCKR